MNARRAWNARYTKIMMIAAIAVVVPGTAASEAVGAKAAKFGQRTMRPGMKGQDVETLQENLARLGFNIPADGDYGPQTVSAVKKFQKTEELPVEEWLQAVSEAIADYARTNREALDALRRRVW